MTTRQELWVYKDSGEIIAVELDDAGKVLGATDCLHHSEVSWAVADRAEYPCELENVPEDDVKAWTDGLDLVPRT